jgi:hypothetical protein
VRSNLGGLGKRFCVIFVKMGKISVASIGTALISHRANRFDSNRDNKIAHFHRISQWDFAQSA